MVIQCSLFLSMESTFYFWEHDKKKHYLLYKIIFGAVLDN